jgi:hypothetical protein
MLKVISSLNAKLTGFALHSVLQLFEMAVLLKGCNKIVWKVVLDYLIKGMCKGFSGVEEAYLIWRKGGCRIIYWGSAKFACPDTVGSKSVAMFCSFRLFAVWRFMEWKSHLAL